VPGREPQTRPYAAAKHGNRLTPAVAQLPQGGVQNIKHHLGRAGVALAPRAAAQLLLDAARLLEARAEHQQAADGAHLRGAGRGGFAVLWRACAGRKGACVRA
jgi:hypothetical protein